MLDYILTYHRWIGRESWLNYESRLIFSADPESQNNSQETAWEDWPEKEAINEEASVDKIDKDVQTVLTAIDKKLGNFMPAIRIGNVLDGNGISKENRWYYWNRMRRLKELTFWNISSTWETARKQYERLSSQEIVLEKALKIREAEMDNLISRK